MISLDKFAERAKSCRESMGYTVREMGEKINKDASNISRYETGKTGPNSDVIERMAKIFGVDPIWLMGGDVEKYPAENKPVKRIPVLGTIAAGMPIVAEQFIEGYEYVPADAQIDFCLIISGNSMVGAGLLDGSIVFLKQQQSIEHGEIAAVLIDGENATLKRVYFSGDSIILHAENPEFKDLVIGKKEFKEVRILGKAVKFMREVI